jgi:hypothetical protein
MVDDNADCRVVEDDRPGLDDDHIKNTLITLKH